MASTTFTLEPFAAKQLGELLQEQQEPFTLENYLLERGYLKNKSNSSKFLKRSASSGKNKRNQVILNCSKIIRAVFNKLVSTNLRMKNPESRDQSISVTKIGNSSQETAQAEKFSSSRSTMIFNSCFESDIEDRHVSLQNSKHRNFLSEREVPTETKFQWRCVEDTKQLSPVSVLEETLSDETSPVHNTQHNVKIKQEETSTTSNITTTKKATDDSIFSVSICKPPDQSFIEKPSHSRMGELQELVSTDLSSQYIKFKIAMQQTEQLLFDCVREVVETHGQDMRWKKSQESSGPEEFRKLLCEHIWTWSKQSIGGTQLINLDGMPSAEEWSNFEQQREKIGMEIGDAVLEDISNEIVTDLIKFVPENLSRDT